MINRTVTRGPVVSGRVHDVDALRGFALLGIFVVNITFMASAHPGNLVEDPSFSSPLDGATRFVVAALFSMKFYLLFSFLFGYSFVLQMDAAERAGAEFVPRMMRRVVGLFVLGVGHIVLLYGGDVLTTYAVVCLVLLAMHRVRDRTALRTAGVVYAAVVVSLVAGALFLDLSAFMPTYDEALSSAAVQTQAMLGSPAEIIGHNIGGLQLLVLQAASLQGPTALAMFLLGMVAARRRLFSDLTGQESFLRQAQWIGFPVGLAGGAVYAALGAAGNTWGTTVSVLTAPFLTAAFVATLVRLMHAPGTAWIRTVLAPVGRIALTNYLAQSVVGIILFTGVGLGLAGQVSPPLLFLLAFVVFTGQVAVSVWWLKSHRYGPAEYLLRWFTTWHRPGR
ncbi:MAG TPA: DUF418 domain-containing protein [Candidatus Nocardiopsis merdipullorum]|nr:DUF418 domain-containing protein [Candidatus Nocardiopsis merdipullorum]